MLQRAPWFYVPVYALLIFVRNRWVNVALLAVALGAYAWGIVPMRLAG